MPPGRAHGCALAPGRPVSGHVPCGARRTARRTIPATPGRTQDGPGSGESKASPAGQDRGGRGRAGRAGPGAGAGGPSCQGCGHRTQDSSGVGTAPLPPGLRANTGLPRAPAGWPWFLRGTDPERRQGRARGAGRTGSHAHCRGEGKETHSRPSGPLTLLQGQSCCQGLCSVRTRVPLLRRPCMRVPPAAHAHRPLAAPPGTCLPACPAPLPSS